MQVENCPVCGKLESVVQKVIAITKSPTETIVRFEILYPEAFEASPYTFGDYFVNALFCRECECGFIPEAFSREMGLGENMIGGMGG